MSGISLPRTKLFKRLLKHLCDISLTISLDSWEDLTSPEDHTNRALHLKLPANQMKGDDMKSIRSHRTTLLIAALMTASTGFASAPPPAAAPAGEELSLSDLLNIKLQTGSFLELDLAKSPLSMTIIDRNKIELAGARNMSELLEIYVPGFQYMFNKWNGVIWGMRGVANDRNSKFIVLVNGHKMNTEARDGYFQETMMGLFGDVERIEVLRGPAGLVYGSGAIAGILNVVTREATKNGAEVQARAGTYSNLGNTYTSAQGTVMGKIADDQSIVATVGWEKSDGVGNGISRIYGQGSWPYPGGPAHGSVPSDGSAGMTPGNWKAAVDYKIKGFDIYGRATHQVQEAGAQYIRDPWPNYYGTPNTLTAPDPNAGPVLIDGKTIQPSDPFWGSVEDWNCGRREYVSDNIMLDLTYDLALGDNTLKFHGGVDGNTNRIQRELREGYETADPNERNSFIEETFGERRYTMGVNYLIKSISKLQLAVGGEQRFDQIGDDLSGRNSKGEQATHNVVSDILYSNTALFTEGWYDVMSNLGIDFGARWDGHTRTIDDGGTINGKLAGVYTPVPGHTIKLIFQSSSNNGSADNYEYNRNHFQNDNTVNSAPHYEYPNRKPDASTPIINGVTEEQLHSLTPEKVYSFELTTNHDLGKGLAVAPSISYNMVRNLFVWNDDLYRVVNAGQYNHLDADLQVDWNSKYVDVGANHAIQMVVNTDVNDPANTFMIPSKDTTTGAVTWKTNINGKDTTYTPILAMMKKGNLVADQITGDGTNFYSLATHVTKFWVNVKPLSWFTIHSDVRIFWGLAGRDSIYQADQKAGYDNQDVGVNPITKWNVSLHAKLPSDWTVGVYAYDILGEATGSLAANSFRWQYLGVASGQKDLYTMDLRSFAMDVKKSF